MIQTGLVVVDHGPLILTVNLVYAGRIRVVLELEKEMGNNPKR